jgi:CheY-like chemotaxis protein
VVVVADDLMWSTRIVEAVRRAGGAAVPLSTEPELDLALEAFEQGDVHSISGAVVDLATRRIDGIAAVARIAAARLPVIALAQHDDQLTRKRAITAGALRVFSYRKFFEAGTRVVDGWLAANAPAGDRDALADD